MKFSVRQGTMRDETKVHTSSRDLSIMSYKVLSCFEVKRWVMGRRKRVWLCMLVEACL